MKTAAVDGLVNVDVNNAAADAVAKDLGLPLVGIDHIDQNGITQWSAHPADFPHGPWGGPETQPLIARENGDLWEAVAAGDLLPQLELEMADTTLAPHRPRTVDEVGRSQLAGHTLLDRTLTQFPLQSARNGPWPTPTLIWVTAPNSLKDCLWFWNLRALRPLGFDNYPMLLLPSNGVEHWVDFHETVRAALTRAEDIEPDVDLCSLSVGVDRLRAIAKHLELEPNTQKRRNVRRFGGVIPARSGPHTFDLNVDVRQFLTFGRTYGKSTDALVQLYRPTTTVRLSSPIDAVGAIHTLARLSSDAFDGLPRRPRVASLIANNATWSGGSLQLAIRATAQMHFNLAIPTLEEAVWAVLQSSTQAAHLSDKGHLATRLNEIGLTSVLLSSHVVPAITRLTTPRSKELLRELRRMEEQGAADAQLVELAASWGGRVERRYVSTDQLTASVHKDVVSAAEALTSAGWSERGLEIRCNRCSLRSFVPLSQTMSRAVCPACQATQQYQTPEGLEMHYRLNALVDRGSDQGVIPHLLAVAALQAADPHASILPGVDVTLRSGHVAEVDLFGVFQGQVVSGEAKTTSAQFSPDQIERDVSLSVDLGADVHLIACPTTLPDAVTGAAKTHANRAGLRLMAAEGASVRAID